MLKILFVAAILSAANCSKKNDEKPVSPPVVVIDSAFTKVPDLADMTVYEMNIPVFSTQGNFQGAIQQLDSVKNLGINVIWVMPIYPLGYTKAVGSPYCITSYKEVNPSLGSMDDLKEFVRAAHKKEMAVILDWVADHTSWDHPWISQHKAWYKQDANGNILPPAGTNWNDVAQLNFSNSTLREEMIKAMKYWIEEANIDGYRFDAIDFMPSSFWKQALDSLKAMPERKIILLGEGGKPENYADGFQMNYSWDFSSTLKKIYKGDKASTIFAADLKEYNAIPANSYKLRYITNHDENFNHSLTEEYLSPAGSVAAFVATAFSRGIPLIYNGQEIGYSEKISFFQTGNNIPIDWSVNPSIYSEYKKIMSVRNSLNAVKRGSSTNFNDDNIIAFKRTYQNEEVLILVNVRGTNTNYTIPATLKNTSWSNLISGANVELSSTLTLEPYSYLILKNK